MSTALFRSAPAIGYSLIKDGDTRAPDNLVIFHGLQPATGLDLNKADLDSHTPGQDAAKADARRQSLRGEQAQLSAFLTLEPPNARHADRGGRGGFNRSPGWQRDYPRLQVLTLEDLLRGTAQVKMPPAYAPFKQAEQQRLCDQHQHTCVTVRRSEVRVAQVQKLKRVDKLSSAGAV